MLKRKRRKEYRDHLIRAQIVTKALAALLLPEPGRSQGGLGLRDIPREPSTP